MKNFTLHGDIERSRSDVEEMLEYQMNGLDLVQDDSRLIQETEQFEEVKKVEQPSEINEEELNIG